jgi:hypothetical protein
MIDVKYLISLLRLLASQGEWKKKFSKKVMFLLLKY